MNLMAKNLRFVGKVVSLQTKLKQREDMTSYTFAWWWRCSRLKQS